VIRKSNNVGIQGILRIEAADIEIIESKIVESSSFSRIEDDAEIKTLLRFKLNQA
jgi:hypothetical protein